MKNIRINALVNGYSLRHIRREQLERSQKPINGTKRTASLILPFLLAKNRFDVDLIGKMAKFDPTKPKFGIPTKNAYYQ